MSPDERSERRTERVAFETDRQRIVGEMTLPATGYQSRFSDSLNRSELAFVALTDVEITDLASGEVRRREFILLGKRYIRCAYPAGD
jgi:hypothetical protein